MKTFTYDGTVRIEKEVYQAEFSIPSFIDIDHDDPNDVYMDGDQIKFHYDLDRKDVLKLMHGMKFKDIRAMLMKNTSRDVEGDTYVRPVNVCLHSSQFPIIKMFDPEFDEDATGDVWIRFWMQQQYHYIKDADGNNVMEPVFNKFREEWQERAKTYKTYRLSAVLEIESDYLEEQDSEYSVDVWEN